MKDEIKKRWIQDILRIGIPLLIVLIVLHYIILGTTVMSGSMEPNLKVGNTAVYNRLAYRNSQPQRGDIVIFWSEAFEKYFAKRVIGITGDNIEFHNGDVYINGQQADESEYLTDDVKTYSDKTFVVPEGKVFVMGDNREYSYDSRFWEMPFVDVSEIKGKYLGQIGFSIKYWFLQKTGHL